MHDNRYSSPYHVPLACSYFTVQSLPSRPGRIIPVLSPIILSFDSSEIIHYSHNFVPIILDYSQQTVVRRCYCYTAT